MRPGFLSGEYTDFGKWDECVSINNVIGDKSLFQGKFCVYELNWPLPKTREEESRLRSNFSNHWVQTLIKDSDSFRFQPVSNSLCLPSVCSKQEIQSAIQFCEYTSCSGLISLRHCLIPLCPPKSKSKL